MDKLEVIEAWFRDYGDDIYNYLIYYTRRIDNVDDLVQDVFIKAMKGFDQFKADSNPKTWLITIARHVAIDSFRKKRPIPYDLTEQPPLVGDETPELYYERKEQQDELYQVIQGLKEDYRDVILLRAWKGFSIAETAEVLNWTTSKVKVTYHRALKVLKKNLMEKEGYA